MKQVLLLTAVFLTGCSRAPSFDLFGSFFPAWLLCLALGIMLTGASHWLLGRAQVALAVPVVTYPSLTALFTFTVWLSFFQ